MTHKPPLPDAAQAPYPPHPAPRAHPIRAKVREAEPGKPAVAVGSIVAGAVIGSAAMLAGLLFARGVARLVEGDAKPKPQTKSKPRGKPAAAKRGTPPRTARRSAKTA